MIFQDFNFTGQYDVLGYFPIMTFLGILFLFGLMIFLYLKLRIFWIISIVYTFSLLIGFSSFSESIIPFTPYLQIFFLLFQTAIFLQTAYQVFEKENKRF